MNLFWTLLGLVVLFWGSRRDRLGTRIMLLGFVTLYERRRDPALGPPVAFTVRLFGPPTIWDVDEVIESGTIVVEQEEDDDDKEDDEPDEVEDEDDDEDDDDEEEDEEEEEEPDERDLHERLTDAGFEIIDTWRRFTSEDVASIYCKEGEHACSECNADLYALWEIFEAQSDLPALNGRPLLNPIGEVCISCGDYQGFEGDPPMPVGVLWPVLEGDVNFFDALASFEAAYGHAARLKNPPKPDAAGTSESER